MLGVDDLFLMEFVRFGAVSLFIIGFLMLSLFDNDDALIMLVMVVGLAFVMIVLVVLMGLFMLMVFVMFLLFGFVLRLILYFLL